MLTFDANNNLNVTVAASGGGAATANQGTPAALTAGWPTTDGTVAVNTQTWTTGVAGTDATVNCTGYNTVIATFNGSGTISTGTGVFEVSDDGGTTWFSISGKGPASASSASSVTLTATSVSFQFNVAGFTNFRARNSVTITGAGGQSIVRVQGSAAVNQGNVVVTQTTASNFQVTANSPSSTTASAPASTAVTSSSSSILATNANRREAIVVNTDVVTVYIGLGQVPTATAYHVALKPCAVANDGTGGSFVTDLWKGAINAITASTSGHVAVTELT